MRPGILQVQPGTLTTFHHYDILGLGGSAQPSWSEGRRPFAGILGTMFSFRRPPAFRTALLAAVAVSALGGAVVEKLALPEHAVAAASAPIGNPNAPSAISPQPAAGP